MLRPLLHAARRVLRPPTQPRNDREDLSAFLAVAGERRLYLGGLTEFAVERGFWGCWNDAPHGRQLRQDLRFPLAFPDESVDVIQSEDVFEHLTPEILVQTTFPELHRILRRGGWMRISVPDYRCPLLRERTLKTPQGDLYFDPGGGGSWDAASGRVIDGGHLWFPVFETLRDLIEASTLRHCPARWLQFHASDGSKHVEPTDYGVCYVQRTSHNDDRVRASGDPLSLVVDLFKP